MLNLYGLSSLILNRLVVAKASADGSAKQWDMYGQCVNTFVGERCTLPTWLRCIYSYDGETILTGSGSAEGAANRWSVNGVRNPETGRASLKSYPPPGTDSFSFSLWQVK